MTKRYAAVAVLSLLSFLASGIWYAHSQDSQVFVGELVLVSSARVSRTHSDFTYRVRIHNQAGALRNVAAYVQSQAASTQIIDNEALVGAVAAGATILSTDTITLRQDRTVAFDPAALEWTIVAEPANTAPLANAGPDQTVRVGDEVVLDGSASSDADGDALTYHWSFISRPVGSAASLDDASAVLPRFAVDRAGAYVLTLVVRDGRVDSTADQVQISTTNSAPIASAGVDRTVPRGTRQVLDGSASTDPDGDALNYQWTLIARPAGSNASLENADTINPALQIDVPGTYTARLTVSDGTLSSSPDEVRISTENSIPLAHAGEDRTGTVGDTITLDGSMSSDADGDALSYFWTFTTKPEGSGTALDNAAAPAASFLADAAGLYVVQLIVNDGFGDSSPATATVAIEVAPPPLDTDADGLTDQQEIALGTDPADADSDDDTLSDGAEVLQHHTNPNARDTDADSFADAEEIGSGADPRNAASTPAGSLPRDPATLAPPVNPTEMTTIFGSTAFLYSGSNPLQTGVAPNTIEARRVAVIRGKVLGRDGAPLAGVAVSVSSHPELGRTLSRIDGAFDLVVNGGSPLTIDYVRTGFLPVQRTVHAPWQNYVAAPAVVLIPLDTKVTSIDLAATTAMQVAQGTQVTDAEGSRRASVLFPQGTTATMVRPDGSAQPLTHLSVRATEYTVGSNGPQAMPGALPQNSGYTYAVELSVDEALAAGASEVTFNQPVPYYIENFLGFPAGTVVPLGSYNRARGIWEASDSGRVIGIVSVTAGLANVDVTGDNVADTGAALAALAITDAERQQLASLYGAGQSLWRVRIPHFSAWDINWGIAPPPDAVAPDEDPEADEPLDCQSEQAGSIIGCQNQTLGQIVGVVGTPFTLHYQSERIPGSKAAYTLEIPLSGAQLPESLQRIELEVFVAGQAHTQSFAPAPNLTTPFTWNGKDAYGRTLQGVQRALVRIGYTYGAVYSKTSRFGYNGEGAITGSRARQQVTLWRTWEGEIGAWDARAVGLGGWTLSAHHSYDPIGQVLYRGDGRRQTLTTLGPVIDTVAGGVVGGQLGCGDGFGDGSEATRAEVCPRALATAADGSLYIAEVGARVRRLDPDGIITTVAGTGLICVPDNFAACGDGGPATQARFNALSSLAVAPDGTLYIGDINTLRVRRVGLDGIITTVAGNGASCPSTTGACGDGGAATSATVIPTALAVAADGNLYIADGNTRRVRRVGADGIISTVAGNGGRCSPATAPCGDGGPARFALLGTPHSIAVGRDGSLYIGDSIVNRVRRVTADGIILTIAGTGAQGFSGDGGLATHATFRGAAAVTLGGDESLYVFDAGNRRVRWLRPDGTINTLAGNGTNAVTGDGGVARQAALMQPDQPDMSALAVGADGSLYVAQSGSSGPLPRVRRIASSTKGLAIDGGGFAASRDGSEIYVLGPGGRHLRTVDGLTGAVRYEFTYDSAGRLASVADRDGNITSIERNAAGDATAIIGPFGKRTTLSRSADGYLSGITNPAGEEVQVAYAADGLLTRFTTPRGTSSSYAYDGAGRLASATDPTDATKTLTRTGRNEDFTVTVTDALGRATTYRVERTSTGDTQSTTTDAAGARTQVVTRKDGSETVTHADGTIVSAVLAPDPRWGMQAPFAKSVTVRTPGGNVATSATERTVTLVSSGDLLSLRTFNETTTVNGRALTNTYDAATRTFTQTSPAGRRRTAILYERGRVAQEQLGDLAPTTYTYDLRGRLANTSRGMGDDSRVTGLSYGSDGLPASITDPVGRTLAFAKDSLGRVTELTLANGASVRFAYDANGNVSGRTPPGRTEHTFGYNERDQLATYTAPAVGAESNQTRYAFAADRQPSAVLRPDGQSVGLQYDAGGRLSVVTLSSGQRTVGYDAASRPSTLEAPAVSLAYAYDGSLRTRTTWSGVVAGSVAQTYDNNFRITSLSVNDSAPVAVLYDTDGLMTKVGDLVLTRAAQTGLVAASTLGSTNEVMSYDSFGAIESYTASSGSSTLYEEQYTRDLLGRLIGKTVTTDGVTQTLAYSYDPAGRLSGVRQDDAVLASYVYDANGNRLARSDSLGTVNASYDARDRLVQYGGAIYAYTPNGELQSKTNAGQSTAYRYDGMGNLTGVTLADGRQIEYVLDGLGRRVGKRVGNAIVQAFLYEDGLRPIAELNGSGAVVSRFIYATGGTAPDYFIKDGVTYRVFTDHLGSPRLIINVDDGTIAQRLDYDEFGRIVLDTHPGFQPFGFAGGLYDGDTGLTRFGARDYDAETGRWTTSDPIGFAGGDSNLYAYVGNDPVNDVDPAGLVRTTVDAACAAEPAVCVEIAAIGTSGAAATIRYGQPLLQVAQRGGQAVVNAVCRIPTLPGLGNLGPAGPVNLGTASTLPGNVQRVGMTLQSIAPNVAQNAERLRVVTERAFAAQSPTFQWWWRTVQATSSYRDTLPTFKDRADHMSNLWDLAVQLFGTW